MPRPRSAVPAYRHHSPSSRVVVTVVTSAGRRRQLPVGPFGSPDSRRTYACDPEVLFSAGE